MDAKAERGGEHLQPPVVGHPVDGCPVDTPTLRNLHRSIERALDIGRGSVSCAPPVVLGGLRAPDGCGKTRHGHAPPVMISLISCLVSGAASIRRALWFSIEHFTLVACAAAVFPPTALLLPRLASPFIRFKLMLR